VKALVSSLTRAFIRSGAVSGGHGMRTLPLHRFGTADEAGAAVVFLMVNGWMNGATLKVDGGSRLA
jgi:NAD(P)-dependent dehydrogenase (short-subunit alcohol dehydrogenase family)